MHSLSLIKHHVPGDLYYPALSRSSGDCLCSTPPRFYLQSLARYRLSTIRIASRQFSEREAILWSLIQSIREIFLFKNLARLVDGRGFGGGFGGCAPDGAQRSNEACKRSKEVYDTGNRMMWWCYRRDRCLMEHGTKDR